MDQLLALEARGELTTSHVRLVADAVGVSLRTVWRWLAAARAEGRTGARQRERFTVTPQLHARLVLWCGNAAAVHRELLAEACAVGGADDTNDVGDQDHEGAPSPAAVPSLATLHRAIRRDLNPGQRAALVGGERARRRHDVHLRRPRQWRNACWEGDHKHVPVEVDLHGELVCPWVTWFIDCAHDVVTGVAITPHTPSRDAILAALRTAIARDEPDGPYGPIGGLPALVRIDRGKDFLSRTVSAALGAFAVPVHDLPAYTPHLKGTVENLNLCAERMFFASLPRYTHAPTASVRRRDQAKDDTAPLTFTAFVQLLLDWVRWWNIEHTSPALAGRTPLQAWLEDPTPIEDPKPGQLWAFTLEDDGTARTLTTSGVYWRGRYYVGEWMQGLADDGIKVRIRYLPHHTHEIEVVDAITGAHLGAAHLADAASDEQRAAVRRTRSAEQRRLRKALTAAEKLRTERFAAVTTARTPQPLQALTAAEAEDELAAADGRDLRALALPGLIPHTPLPDGWVMPRPTSQTRRNPSDQHPPQPAETDPPR
ncbi:Mu transposase C-terminal domain-containing protein [Kitasatospora sp. NPDC101155]|uniref:Mu transposase C-terminal domain-containing protein n=1 Tax=Kitasatospora sp. NPDC101155 TaxID=3364097 RepID=UPI00382FA798